jgi:hypothetical protein
VLHFITNSIRVEALKRSIHNAHFALIEPTPDAKATSTTAHPDLQPPSAPSPLPPRTKRGNTLSKLDPPAHDEFTFIASSASEFSPPPAKRMRGKTTGNTVKAKDRKPQRSKSTGRTPDPVAEEESDTWEPANASRLLGEPIGVRRTRGMGDDGVVEGLPKPKRPKRNAIPKEPVSSEIKIDLTDDGAALSATQKQEYERISVPPSSPPHKPPAVPALRSGTSIVDLERDPEESSTIPFSSSPPILDRLSARVKLGSKFEEPQAANLNSSMASTSASRTPKTYGRMRRAKTVTGAGNEHIDRTLSGDELSLGFERKKLQRNRAPKSPEELGSKSGTKGPRPSSSVTPGDYASGEDELGFEGIEIVKENYRPRPSRSRGGGDVVEQLSTEMGPPKSRRGNEKQDVQSPDSAIPPETKPKAHPDVNETDTNSKAKSPAAPKANETDGSEFEQPIKTIAKRKRKKSTVAQEEDDKRTDHTSHSQGNPPTKSNPKKRIKPDTNNNDLEPAQAASSSPTPLSPTTINTLPPQPQSTPPPQPASSEAKKKSGQHSPLNSGKVPYRVGLSRRVRIEPLLRCVRK